MCTLILKSVDEFIADSIIKIEQGISDILYLRWNERRLRTYFETLMTQL